MKPLFSQMGKQLIDSLGMANSIFAFDFDGTLAPIVGSPDAARMSIGVLKLLEQLSENSNVVILSGRSVKDLRKRVPIKRVTLIGNHGFEGFGASADVLSRSKEICHAWNAVLIAMLGNLENFKGIMLEDKTFSIAIHYRLSRNKKVAKLKILEVVSQLKNEPRIVFGKCVVNLIPPGGPHKGMALIEAMSKFRAKSAIYVGDDDTDEDVFSLPDQGIISVRVGKLKQSSAQFFVERQCDIKRVLQLVIEARSSK